MPVENWWPQPRSAFADGKKKRSLTTYATGPLARTGSMLIRLPAWVRYSFEAGGEDNIRWYAGLGGGALFDLGCYCVNVSRTVIGQEPARVAAFGNYRDAKDNGQVDASLAGMLRFPGSATALFDIGVNLERRNYLEIAGTEGRLYLDNPFGLLEEDSVLEEYHFGQDVIYHEVKGENHFVRMGEHFADSVLNGIPLRYDLTDSANNAQVLESLDKAARQQERGA